MPPTVEVPTAPKLDEARPDTELSTVETVETVLEAIRCECQHDSERYLLEVRVPLGGE
jgi:hypothetical protein